MGDDTSDVTRWVADGLGGKVKGAAVGLRIDTRPTLYK